jgi:hypothetical protein
MYTSMLTYLEFCNLKYLPWPINALKSISCPFSSQFETDLVLFHCSDSINILSFYTKAETSQYGRRIRTNGWRCFREKKKKTNQCSGHIICSQFSDMLSHKLFGSITQLCSYMLSHWPKLLNGTRGSTSW